MSTLVPANSLKRTLASSARRYHANLMQNPDDPAFLWLTEERGLSEETLVEYQIGVVAPDSAEPEHQAMIGYVSMPYITPTSRTDTALNFADIRFRRGPDVDEEKPKVRSITGHRSRLYCTTTLANPGSYVAIAEGECLPPWAEVLTPSGWIPFGEYAGEEVAQWDHGEVAFVKPLAVVEKEYSGKLVDYTWRGYSHISTPGHRMPIIKPDGQVLETTAEKGRNQDSIPRVGILDGPGIDYTDTEIRLLLAIAADGTIRDYPKGQYVVQAFTKARKVDRLVRILDFLGIDYTSNPRKGGYWGVNFYLPEHLKGFKRLPWSWVAAASADQRELILAELAEWDGNSVPNRNQSEFSSKDRSDCEWVQAMAHTSGRCSSIIERSNQHGKWFKASILHDKRSSSWQMAKKSREDIEYKGTVHCVTVPSSFFMVRINGQVSVTGNCDTLTLNQCGIPAVGVAGVSAWNSDYYDRIFSGFEKVIIPADNDDDGQGQDFAERIAKDVPNPKIVLMPEGEDVNSFFVKYGAGELRDHLGVN